MKRLFTPSPRRRVRPAGMTLIEVMISFAILIAGLVAIFAMITVALRAHKRAMNETEAGMVAESALADLRSEFQRGNIRMGSGGAFEASTDFPKYRVRRTIVPLDPKKKGLTGDLTYFARVEVRWSDEGNDKSFSLDTILLNNREPGSRTSR